MGERSPITAIVLTYNEAVNIADCLRALDWVDDVVIVDSGSTDDTIARARAERADVRVFIRPFTDFGDQRNWALDNTEPKHDWILFVDADERMTSACADAIQRTVRQPDACDGYFLTYRNIFMGRWIRHSTLYPSWQLRLLRRRRVRFQREGHGQREVAQGPLGYIREPFDHFPFSKGIEEWVARHNVYSTREADLILRLRAEPLRWRECFSRDPIVRRRALKRLAARWPGRPFWRFVYMYILRGGFLDGKAGWIYAQLRIAHEIHIVAKLSAQHRVDSARPF